MGKPLAPLKIAFHCQPPINFSAQPVAPLPNALPYWFRWNCGTGVGFGALATSKKFRVSSALLRKYSKTDPRHWFVPEVVTMVTCAPARFPYSAIGVPQDVEFPHRVDSEQIPAYPLGRRVHTGCVVSDVLHSVNREAVLIRPLARDRERGLVPIGRIRPVAYHV